MSLKNKISVPSHFLLLPAILGLISSSVLLGYASTALETQQPDDPESRVVCSPEQGAPPYLMPASLTPASEANDLELIARTANDPVNNYKATLEILHKYYYGGPIDAKKRHQLTYEAIRGMLGSLNDQFTSFLDPDDWAQMRATTHGDFEGIGASLDGYGSRVVVEKPIEGSPAEAAGLLAGDIILKVDGETIRSKNLSDAVRRIKGPSGTVVHLTILRDGETLEFNITRALVEPPIVQSWMEDTEAKIGHIVLNEFNEKSITQLKKSYNDLSQQGMRALVFDLRYNPGGLLETAVDVASVFIPRNQEPYLKNVVVYTREGKKKEKSLVLRPSGFMIKPLPMVILVNSHTASAAEIVSAAIRDYDLAPIFGERTYGKGKVQTLYPLDDGSALRLTTANYFTPKHGDINFERDENGVKLEGTGGIVPDWKSNNPLDGDVKISMTKPMTHNFKPPTAIYATVSMEKIMGKR